MIVQHTEALTVSIQYHPMETKWSALRQRDANHLGRTDANEPLYQRLFRPSYPRLPPPSWAASGVRQRPRYTTLDWVSRGNLPTDSDTAISRQMTRTSVVTPLNLESSCRQPHHKRGHRNIGNVTGTTRGSCIIAHITLLSSFTLLTSSLPPWNKLHLGTSLDQHNHGTGSIPKQGR